ncbi:S8 family serine peptidase, partial [Moraxella sp. TY6]
VPTPTPTPIPTPTPTPVPTPEPTPVPTPEPTPVPTPEPTPVPTPEPTPVPTPEPTPTPVPTPTPTPVPTPEPTPVPTPEPTPVPTPVPTPTPTPVPTPTPTPIPTPTPTPVPTPEPTPVPTPEPTPVPTPTPTPVPTPTPTPVPTPEPTPVPTPPPTPVPTPTPTPVPTPTPTPVPTPTPTPVPTPTPTPEVKADYVTPFTNAQLTKPTYERKINADLQASQPKPTTGTHTGYSTMDSYYAEVAQDKGFSKNLTEKFYGATEEAYAKSLQNLRNTIDSRNISIGVVDSGINRNNKGLVGANVHDTQLKLNSSTSVGEYATTYASGDHGSQMATVAAGNDGYSNAKIYGSDTIGEGTRNGNQFFVTSELNKRYGVKIFNNSWGSDNTDQWIRDAKNLTYNKDTGAVKGNSNIISIAEQNLPYIHDLILNRDVLMLKATGNEGKDDAYDENLAPLINDKFKQGFITVSSPREDFDKANYCGRTAEWCISATSTTKNFKNNGELSDYQGTSPATARVTGTAALIKAAYPWMKNKNLTETLLGTAKDFDDIIKASPTYQGVRRVSNLPYNYRDNYLTGRDQNTGQTYYLIPDANMSFKPRTPAKVGVNGNINGKNITWENGWGLLDPETATKGYGGFYWDDVVLDTAGTKESVFYNDLKGDKGFTKKGDGKLVFMGNNSYKGDSVIEGGVLEVNGNNGNSAMFITGGELTGFGKVKSVNQTKGWLNNEGNLAIDGDYTVNATDKENTGFKAKFGNLTTVNGIASLGGKLALTGETKDGLITEKGNRITVLRANGGITKQFDSHASINPLFELTKVEYTPQVNEQGEPLNASDTTNKDVQITAKRLKASNVVSSVDKLAPSTQEVAQNLDKALSELDAKQETRTLTDSEKQFANNVIEHFAGSIDTDATLKAMATNSNASPVLSAKATNQQIYQLDPTIYSNSAVNAVEESFEQTNDFSQRLVKNDRFWADTHRQDYDLKVGEASSNRTTNNQTIGTGLAISDSINLAIQADIAQLKNDEDVYGIHNTSDTDMTAITVGINKNLNQDSYLLGWAKGATLETKTTRSNTNSHQVSQDGNLYGAGIQVGSNYQLNDRFSVNPYALTSYHQYKADNMVNDGVNQINDLNVKQWQMGVGMNANYQVNPAWKVYGGLQFTEAVDRDAKLNTNYVGTESALQFKGWDTGKDKLKATVGTSYQISDRSSVGVSYDYMGSEHSDSQRVNLGFTSKF